MPITGHFWASTGDENTARQVYLSTDNGATWTPNIFLDIDGTTRLQMLAIIAYRGWIYMGEDNDGCGRIMRFKQSNIQGTFDAVYDPDVDGMSVAFAGTPASALIAPIYALGVDPVFNVLYVHAPGESSAPYTNHGRLMASADGINFNTIYETGAAGIYPGSSVFAIQAFTGGYYVYYGNVRMRRRLAYRAAGMRPAEQVVLTFNIPGAVATQAEVLAGHAAMLGFSCRVVRAGIFVQTAQTGGTLVAAFKKNGNNISATDAIVSAATVGAARYADITLHKGDTSFPFQYFKPALSDLLTWDITNNGAGGSGLAGFIVLEKQAGPVLVK
jgi:hypothetical protein